MENILKFSTLPSHRDRFEAIFCICDIYNEIPIYALVQDYQASVVCR
jgi:hypothetical protein